MKCRICVWSDGIRNSFEKLLYESLVLCLEPRRALPNLVTDEAVCPIGQLQCGDGACIGNNIMLVLLSNLSNVQVLILRDSLLRERCGYF